MTYITVDSVAITLDSVAVTLDSGPIPPSPPLAPLTCPTDSDAAFALAALRPRGDAWRNGGFDALEGSVMGRFFTGLGAGFGPAHRQICAMVAEFFCATADQTLDVWRVEYGVPDGCDPFEDVCEKVNAVGDTTSAYAVAAAARRGWSIAIAEDFITNVEDCTAGLGLAGTMLCGAETGVKWTMTAHLTASSAYVAADDTEPLAGLLLPGEDLACPPDVSPLECLIRRIAPAHADLEFLTIT